MSSNIPYSEKNDKTEDQILLGPFTHLLSVQGKNLRKTLMSAFNYWLKISDEKLNKVGNIVQMLHNASLLLDDIEDNSTLRRGIPVAHRIYGEANTINSANYVMFIALEKILLIGHPEAVKIYTEQLLELHRGQGMEIYWRDIYQCPTEEEYKRMIIRKTGGLFNLGIKLMTLFSDKKSDFSELIKLLGLYYQIRDDYSNLISEEYHSNKCFAEDLTEGKFSFPIIHGIRSDEKDTRISNILRQRTQDFELKKYCISLLEEKGSFEYTRSVLKKLDTSLCEEIKKHGGNPQLEDLLISLRDWDC